jgi:methionyl-tRNA formyltransferase
LQDKKRIVFAGTPDNASITLSHLVDSGLNIVGVLTRVDAKTGRNGVTRESPVARQAAVHNIPIYKTNVLDSNCRDWVRSREAELGVVVAFGAIFDSEFLGLPKFGWLNLHYSMLPELRGAAPVQNAILRGHNETGVTVFRLDQGIDTGSIVAQERLKIEKNENAGELLQKLTRTGAELLASVLSDLDASLARAYPQPKMAPDEIARKPTRQSAKLVFAGNSANLAAKVRAMNPEPMSWFEFDGKSVRVLEAEISSVTDERVGVARLVDKELVVSCSEGGLVLKTVQPAGKSPMSGADWFRGLRRHEALIV